MNSPRVLAVIVLAFLCTACGGNDGPTTVQNAPAPSVVFTMSNAIMENTVLVYTRSSDGGLLSAGSSSTGGTGVGHGLENQGALALSQDGRFLYVVNPGSNDLAVFRISGTTLQLADRVPSGGTLPISVAEWNGIAYVLNRNATSDPDSGPTVQGFRLSSSGALSAIPGSATTLRGANTKAAQIGISPDGRWLV